MFLRWRNLPERSFLLLGPRRAGKTTLLKQLFPNYKYVTLDDFDYLSWAKSDPKGMIESIKPKAIIDEISESTLFNYSCKIFS
ncbi:MAG: hypothetical protein D6780_00750 [Candidatus Dadabacteria bacterium]|nr:MAG: hypothetical protein D6780_00750 [Candidatus Dadabacteria bacterium]